MANIFGTEGDNDLDGTAGNDKIYGYGGADDLDGGDGNDVLYGGDGNDVLTGGEGDDQLSGGDGDDDMTGGAGNDTYYVDQVGDTVTELAGGGLDTVVTTINDYRIGDNIERLTLAESAGAINGRGNSLDNSLKGNSSNNHLTGYAGNDSLSGFGGDDVLNGGDGNDVMDGGDGVDLVTYKGGASGVTVDLAIDTRSQNTIGSGVDTLKNVENLEGTDFADTLLGNAGANQINGLGGGDFIRGRAGDDDLRGGAGGDTFRFEAAGAANGVDRIRGFETGTDTLEFHVSDGYDAGATLTITASGTAPVASGSGAQFIWVDQLDQLYYDADGDGAGAAVLLANFATTATISSSDIVILP